MGRKKLADQIAVRRVDLDAVHTGLLGNDRTGHKLLDHGFHFFSGQCAGLFPDDFAGHIGCGNRLSAADEARRRLAAGMMELDEELCVIGMAGFHQAGELPHHMGVGHGELVRCADAGLVIHAGDFGDDQSRAAPCTVGIVFDHARTGFTARFGKGTAHRGHHNAVFQFKIPDLPGLKKF